MSKNEVEYCALSDQLKCLQSSTSSDRSCHKSSIKNTREALLQFLNKHEIDRAELPGDLVLRQRIHITRGTVTASIFEDAWAACYKWRRIEPLLKDGFDFPTALGMALTTEVERIVTRATAYADVVDKGTKQDGERYNMESAPPRENARIRVNDNTLALCKHLQECKEEEKRLAETIKTSSAPLKDRMKHLQDSVVKSMGDNKRCKVCMPNGTNMVLCMKTSKAAPKIGVITVRKTLTPTIVQTILTTKVKAVKNPTNLPAVSKDVVRSVIDAVMQNFKQSGIDKNPARLCVDRTRKRRN